MGENLKLENYIKVVFFSFLLFNPFLDLGINYFGTSLLSYIRPLVLLVLTIYLLFKKNRVAIIYTAIAIIHSIVIINNSYLNSEYFNILSEVREITILYYFIFMFIFINEMKLDKKKLLKYVSINALVISFSIVLAVVTNTSYYTYPLAKTGYTGWFKSSNAIGHILLIGYTMFLNFIENKRGLLYVAMLILLSTVLVYFGTRVTFYGTIIVLVSYIMISAFKLMLEKNIDIKKVLLYATIVAIVFTIKSSLPLEIRKDKQTEAASNIVSSDKDKEYIPINMLNVFTREEALNILSKYPYESRFSRDYQVIYGDYKLDKVNLFTKIFGMGSSDFYYSKIKIEKDIHAVIYYHGWIGFIVLISIFISNLIKSSLILLTNFKNNKVTVYLNFMVLFLMIAVSQLAGHTFLEPNVSIYLAILMYLIFNNINSVEN